MIFDIMYFSVSDEIYWNEWMPFLYKLPADIGDFEKGTVILAATSIYGEGVTDSTITLYSSNDAGKSFNAFCNVDKAGGIDWGVWEPYLIYEEETGRLFDGARSDNEYENLLAVRPQYKDDFIRMILLDFITRQDDRHLSNMAVKVTSEGESFYPLYDNGRSLFYEDTEETVENAVENIEMYATNFGYSGTYYDYICDIAKEGVDFTKLINLDITDEEINEILVESGFKGYRLNGAIKWIRGTVELIKSF